MTTDAAKEFADKAAALTGATPRRYGREWRVPCPVHENDGRAHSPSLAIWISAKGRVSFNCMVGCRWKDVANQFIHAGIMPRPQHMSAAEWQAADEAQARENANKRAQAKALLAEAREIAPTDSVTLYLRERGINLTEGERRFLRTVDDPHHANCQMLLGIICDGMTIAKPDVRAIGVQTLALDENHEPRLGRKGHKLRDNLGLLHGGAVFLGSNARELVVGEGIESTLSAMRLLERSFGAACLGADNMANLELPPFVRSIWLVPDNDVGGEMGAFKCIAVWRPRLTVTVKMWGNRGTGWDANDQLLKELNRV